ncbi:hypothetical protein VKT23_019420 [Stygiomarasmius scandens]|uniref:F-box domain-containing protein n=1 Tax=Marasmiellus scandens TaxID=2682957 RepID=A0ABR1IQP0_9AGAR
MVSYRRAQVPFILRVSFIPSISKHPFVLLSVLVMCLHRPLPLEMVFAISSFLDCDSLKNASLVCRAWRVPVQETLFGVFCRSIPGEYVDELEERTLLFITRLKVRMPSIPNRPFSFRRLRYLVLFQKAIPAGELYSFPTSLVSSSVGHLQVLELVRITTDKPFWVALAGSLGSAKNPSRLKRLSMIGIIVIGDNTGACTPAHFEDLTLVISDVFGISLLVNRLQFFGLRELQLGSVSRFESRNYAVLVEQFGSSLTSLVIKDECEGKISSLVTATYTALISPIVPSIQ